MAFFFSAFTRLSKSRPIGMGPGALVLSEISNYWDRFDEGFSLDVFIDVIQSLDELFLIANAEKSKSNNVMNAKPK